MCPKIFFTIGYFLRTFPVLSETFVSNEITMLADSGMPPFIAALYRPGFEAESHSPRSLHARTLYFPDIDKRTSVRILCANFKYLLNSPTRFATAFTAGASFGLAVKDRIKTAVLAWSYQKNKVTHIHTHFAWEQVDYLRYIHRLTGISFSITLHANDIYVDAERLSEKISDAAFVITISKYNRDYLIKNIGVNPGKVHIVHCGVALDQFKFSQAQTREAPVILSIGRMVEKKGFDVLLHALAILKERGVHFSARILGDGPLRGQLETLSRKLHLAETVLFTGALDSVEVRQEMESCNLFALACKPASDGDRDGIPVVLMEAMAIGRPVVSTRFSGIPELVKKGCGLLAEQDDAEDFASCLATVLQNPHLCSTIAKKGRQIIEQDFSLDRQVNGLLDLIREHSTAGAL